MDVQGSELAMLRHGRDKLAKAVAVQLEVSFVSLYEHQPSFGEIDLEMRAQGFIPHSFPHIKRWPIFPLLLNKNLYEPLNQLLEADIVYVRDFAQSRPMDDAQLKHLALIARQCYQSYDLTLRCLHVLKERSSLPA